MPIRINLLAEAQALEDLRRRDPVKRAIWGGGALVSLPLIYCIWLQVGAMRVKAELNGLEAQKAALDKQYKQVQEDQLKLADVNRKLAKLTQLSTNRFLNGSVLNALQQTTVDDVELVHFKAEEKYIPTPEVPAQTNEDRIIPGKPATVKEQIILTFGARDTSGTGGERVADYRKALGNCTFFQHALSKSNQLPKLTESGPQSQSGFPFVLELRYPERIR
jgi:hypothetical protein